MGEYFGVSLRAEIIVPVTIQLLFERLIIFDHPVMNERDFSAGIEMRVGIFVVHFAVGRPPGVTDAKRARCRFFRHQFRERGDASSAFAHLNSITIDDRYSGRIVTAIFESTQTVEQNGGGL